MNRLDHLRGLLACLNGEMPESSDWTGIIQIANHALCTPMVASRLQQAGVFSALPDDLQRFLREIQSRNAERNRRLLEQLDEAAAHLNAIGVQPALLKGTAWLASVDAAQRPDRLITDLDLMVPARDFGRAVEQLTCAGYRLDTQLVRPGIPVVLLRPEDAGTVDLHGEYGGATTLRFCHDDVAADGSLRHLGRGGVILPSPVASMAILLLHDQLKGRDYLRGRIDLRHLLDMQALAAGFGDAEWERLEQLFATGYARAAARTQLLTAHRLLKMEVPGSVVRDRRARLQYRRRLIQIRWPRIALPLTMLSLLDPQYLAARRSWKRAEAGLPSGGDRKARAWLPRRASVARLLSWKEVGKI